MQAQQERWKKLCEQIAVEQDPARFTTLVDELNKLLEQKEQRLDSLRRTTAQPSKAGRETT